MKDLAVEIRRYATWQGSSLVWNRCPVCGSTDNPSDFWWFQTQSMTEPLESHYGCNHNQYPKLNGLEELERLREKHG